MFAAIKVGILPPVVDDLVNKLIQIDASYFIRSSANLIVPTK